MSRNDKEPPPATQKGLITGINKFQITTNMDSVADNGVAKQAPPIENRIPYRYNPSNIIYQQAFSILKILIIYLVRPS